MTKKKKPEDLLPTGRPTKYTLILAKEICDVIASSELGLIHLVDQNPHWPHRATIYKWLRLHPEFRESYYKAKEDQAEVIVEYMQEAMNEVHKFVDEETGLVKIDVPLLKLKVDTFKWQAGKLKPKKYGDAKALEPVSTEVDEDCKKRYREMDEKNKKDY